MIVDNILISSSDIDLKTENNVTDYLLSTVMFDSGIMKEKLRS